MDYKEALMIAAHMMEIPYNDLMHSSMHTDIIRRMFNLATEIQEQYNNREVPELQ